MTTSGQSKNQHSRFFRPAHGAHKQLAGLLIVCALTLSGCTHLRFDTHTSPALQIGRNAQIREVSVRTLDALQQKCTQTAQQLSNPQQSAINHTCTTLSTLYADLGGKWQLKSPSHTSQLKNPELQVNDPTSLLAALNQSATADRDLALVSTAPDLITALKVQQWKLFLEGTQLAQNTAQKPLPIGKIGAGSPVRYQDLLVEGNKKTSFIPAEPSLSPADKSTSISTTADKQEHNYQDYLEVYDDRDEFFTGAYEPLAQTPEQELQKLQQCWWTLQTLSAQINATKPRSSKISPEILNAQIQQLEKQIGTMEKSGTKTESKLSYPLPAIGNKTNDTAEQLVVILSWIAKLHLDKAISIAPDEKNSRLDAFNDFDQVISTSAQLGLADSVLNRLVTPQQKKP